MPGFAPRPAGATRRHRHTPQAHPGLPARPRSGTRLPEQGSPSAASTRSRSRSRLHNGAGLTGPSGSGVDHALGWAVLVAEHGFERGDVAIEALCPGFPLRPRTGVGRGTRPSPPRCERHGSALNSSVRTKIVPPSGAWVRSNPMTSSPQVNLTLCGGSQSKTRPGSGSVSGWSKWWVRTAPHLPLVDLDASGKPGLHLVRIGDRLPHRLDRPGQVTFESQHWPTACSQQGCFVHVLLFLGVGHSVRCVSSLDRLSRHIWRRVPARRRARRGVQD